MKRFMNVLLICVLGCGASLAAQTANRQSTPPDNTKINKRDQDKARPTADQQKNNQADLKITQDIRRTLTKDKSLSSYAKNIKVITKDGQVTLRGPVRSEQDKKAIEAKANEVAGAGHVTNDIQVVAKKK